MTYKYAILAVVIFIFIYFFFNLWVSKKDYDCSDFSSREAVLKVFDQNDIYHLDGNHDGIPCQTL